MKPSKSVQKPICYVIEDPKVGDVFEGRPGCKKLPEVEPHLVRSWHNNATIANIAEIEIGVAVNRSLYEVIGFSEPSDDAVIERSPLNKCELELGYKMQTRRRGDGSVMTATKDGLSVNIACVDKRWSGYSKAVFAPYRIPVSAIKAAFKSAGKPSETRTEFFFDASELV